MDIVLRARNIVTTPRSEWPVIAAEPPDIAGLSGYVAILAAIPLVAELISLIVMGIPIGGAIAVAVIWSVAFLIDVAVLAGVSSMLAPRFGGVDNLAQGFKLAAYSLTPFWLGGVFLLVYWVEWLILLTLLLVLACLIYSFYLYYQGIAELTRVPPERRVAYFVSVLALTLVIAIVIAIVITVTIAIISIEIYGIK